MKKYFIIAWVFLCCADVNAQEVKFGKVSKEELEETEHAKDADADAAILYKKIYAVVRYDQGEGFQLETNVHERIKIYNKDGFNWANHYIPLYKSTRARERVTGLKAYTYNLENGKVEKTKLRSDGIFKEKRTENITVQKLTMPNIKEGSVVEFRYKMISPYLSNINEIEFQYDIPINKVKVIFQAPQYYTYKKHYKGYFRLNPKEYTKNGKISAAGSSRGLDFLYNVTEFDLANIPALKEESHVSNIENYRSAVTFELSQIAMPRSEVKYLSKSWDNVVKTIYKSSYFGGQLEKTSYFKDDIDGLIAGENGEFKKAAMIYNYVRNKIKWNRKNGKYTDLGVRKAYKENIGNVADINLMLTAMLRYAGVNANPVILSTRRHGISMFPTLNGFNYVIVAIEVDEAVILLDATNYYGEPNILPMRALNWTGRLIRKDGSWNQLNLFPEETAVQATSMNVKLSENGDIEGKQRTQYTSHNAMLFRQAYTSAEEEEFLETLENNIGDIEIDEYEVKNTKNIGKPIIESYAFVKESQAEVIGDKLYFSPLFFFAKTENAFKSESRVYPVDFSYPWKRKVMINIALPEGYVVESLPEPTAVKLPDNLGMYSFNISKTPVGLSVVIQRQINTSIVTPDKYGALREFYKMLVKKETEKVVLKKG